MGVSGLERARDQLITQCVVYMSSAVRSGLFVGVYLC